MRDFLRYNAHRKNIFYLSFIPALCLLEFAYGQLASYGGGAGGGGGGGGPNDFGGGAGDSGGSLEEAIPGTPGVDYPILAEVPETGFSCDGQVMMIPTCF